ncbi:hypothetical protein TNCV_2695641 [Trichonephila clavipes]|nr:hypothetical protein TNCV_2695641 [Trichonephila clavipes]
MWGEARSKAATVGNGTSGFSASIHTAVASTSGAWDMPTPAELVAVDYHHRLPPPALNKVIFCLEIIILIPLVRKRKPSECKKQTSEALTKLQRRATMREKVGK